MTGPDITDPRARGVDDVLLTAELASRPSRTPDYEAESRALGLLAHEMATNPRGVLQKCAELVMELCHADSAGVSILEPGGTGGMLRWHAIAGGFAPNLHGTMLREASPCGTVMDRDRVLLFKEAERFFPGLRGVEPRIHENLLAPWHVDGEAVGTLWAIKHTPEGRFDAEDARLLQSLARFAAAAFQMTSALDEATAERTALRASERQLRDVLDSLSEGFALFDADFTILEVNAETVRLDGRTRGEIVGRNHWEAFPGSEDSPQGEMFKRVMRDRVPAAMEHCYRWPDGKTLWVDTRAYPTAQGKVGILWRDITERKRTEATLRASEERQAFLLSLGDAIREQPSASGKIEIAARLLGERLRASRVLWAEYDWDRNLAYIFNGWFADGAPPFPTVMRLEDYDGEVLRDLRAGRTVRIDDVGLRIDEPAYAAIADVGVQALLSPPLLVDGTLKVNLSIHQHEPRRWTDEEVSLVKEVAERLWAEVVRARAEAALRESEEKYRTLFETMGQGYCELELVRDAQGRAVDQLYLEFNPAFERLFGIPIAKAKGQRASAVFPELDPAWTAYFASIVAMGEPQRIEHSFGSDRWFEAHAYPSGGDRLAVLYEEITDRKRAGRALRDSEERFRLLLQNVRDYAIFTTDRNGVITSWPSGAAAVYGWAEEEILGRSVDLTFLPEDVASGIPEKERETAAREGLAPNVRWHRRKDGSRIFIDGSTQPLVGADGQIREFIKIGQDVTEVRRTQQALAESEQRLRTLMEGIPQLVWRSSDGDCWTWASPQWQAFTGQSQEESRGRGWLDALHPDDCEMAMRAWEEAQATGRLEVEYRLRRASDGAWLWHHSRALPVHGEAGRILEWLGTTTDVQVLKELQQRQQVLVAELQHRTRNLMGVVRSMADKTARASAGLPDFRARFRDRLDALARVQGLLSRLNDHDRVTFDELIRTELAAMNGESRRVTLSGPPGVRLRSSTVQTLAMALHELATNAVKYGALGQPSGRLAISWSLLPLADDDHPWLHIDWRESGVAMPPPGTPPAGTGQGRELIERALPYQLGARTTYELTADGVHCTIALPASASTMGAREHV